MRRFPGGTEQVMKATILLSAPTSGNAAKKEIWPINMQSDIPYHNLTVVSIRYLKVLNKDKTYKLSRWMRNGTQSTLCVYRLWLKCILETEKNVCTLYLVKQQNFLYMLMISFRCLENDPLYCVQYLGMELSVLVFLYIDQVSHLAELQMTLLIWIWSGLGRCTQNIVSVKEMHLEHSQC